MQKAKIFFLLPDYQICGPSKGLAAIVNGLPQSDYDIHFVGLSGSMEQRSHYQKLLSSAALFSFHSLECRGWKDLPRAIHLFKQLVQVHKPHIVQSQGLRPDIVNATCSGYHKRIGSVRGVLHEEYTLKSGPRLGRLFYRVHLRALRRLDKVVCISRYMKSQLEPHLLPGQSAYIANFMDTSGASSAGEPSAELRSLTALKHSGKKIVGTVSSLIRRKRVDWLADFAEKCHRADVCFYVVGSGDKTLEERLEKLSNVLHIPKSSEVAQILALTDYFVLTSNSEGIPRSLMEALWAGTTSLSADIPGNVELTNNGEFGVHFAADSKSEFAQKLEHLLTSQFRFPAEHLKNHIKNNFSERQALAYDHLYKNMLEFHENVQSL